jgi:hypothetical protein
MGGPFSESSVVRASEVVAELLGRITTHHFKNDKLVSAAIFATALRQLCPEYMQGRFDPHDTFLQIALNRQFGMEPPTYSFQAVDGLKQLLIDKLAEHGIAEREGEPDTGAANEHRPAIRP